MALEPSHLARHERNQKRAAEENAAEHKCSCGHHS